MAYNATLGYDPDKDYSLAIRNATSDTEIKQLQNYFGTTADGMWGANSTKAAGGLTADEAWANYDAANSMTITNLNGDGWVYVPGLGRYTYDELEAMVNNGRVLETVNPGTGTVTYSRA